MGPYLGDFAEDAVLDFFWDTNDGDGGSITRATDGTISVYKGNSTTQTVTGVTDDEDFDSLTGVHHCRIDTSDAFYATGNDYTVVLSASTIDGETVNAVLAMFSIENRYAEAMRGTDSAALASVCTEGRLAELDAANLPTDVAAIPTTAMRGTDSAALASVCTEGRLAELDAANLPTDVAAIPTTAMRGTDSAALASVCTEGRLGELDAGNLPTDIAAIPTTAMRGTDSAALASVCTEGRLVELDAANIPTDIAAIPTTAMRGTDSASTHSAADVATALLATTGWSTGGSATIQTALRAIYSMARGKWTRSGDAYTYYGDDGSTPLFTLTVSSGSRTTA